MDVGFVGVPGLLALYDVDAQSTSRTRIELPTGARRIVIFNGSDKDAKVVFNVAGTSEADSALGESASSAGGTVSGVSYVRVPSGKSYERSYPDDDDLLYYLDFVCVALSTGSIIVEATMA